MSRIIPIAQGSGENAANLLSQALSGTAPWPGRFFPKHTMAGSRGRPVKSAPMRDFGATRTGWEAPLSTGRNIYKHMFYEVCEMSVASPAQLVNPASAGPAAHEAWRRLTVGTIEPYARLLESELSRILERPVSIKLRRLAGIDSGRPCAGVACAGRGRI